jgi:hypothetical protein
MTWTPKGQEGLSGSRAGKVRFRRHFGYETRRVAGDSGPKQPKVWLAKSDAPQNPVKSRPHPVKIDVGSDKNHVEDQVGLPLDLDQPDTLRDGLSLLADRRIPSSCTLLATRPPTVRSLGLPVCRQEDQDDGDSRLSSTACRRHSSRTLFSPLLRALCGVSSGPLRYKLCTATSHPRTSLPPGTPHASRPAFLRCPSGHATGSHSAPAYRLRPALQSPSAPKPSLHGPPPHSLCR